MAQPEDTVPASPLDRSLPWTEEAYLELPAHPRIELLDGSLLVSPVGLPRHQWMAVQVRSALHSSSSQGLRVFGEINVRVGPGRILIPDVAVVDAAVSMDTLVVDAADVRLVGEIASPSTVVVDRAVKPRVYADAGIPNLLRIEFTPDGPVGLLSVLDGADYRLVQRAEPGTELRLEEPFAASLDLAALFAAT